MIDLRWLNQHIIDLTKTPWDKDKSDPSKGQYVFTGPKVYYKRGHDSPWKVGFFIRYSPPYREMFAAEARYGITPIKGVDALAIPEGIVPNAEGYFQFEDVILAKEPKMQFLNRMKDAADSTDAQVKAQRNNFVKEGDAIGSKVEVWDI